MKIIAIGGLITSTLLSLPVEPVVFTLVDDGQRWLKMPVLPSWLKRELLDSPVH